jgi:hypothetical protein
MTERPALGKGLFYHRDSEGSSELAPPQYVEWAQGEAARLGVAFTGTPDAINDLIARSHHHAGDLYLDYGISGNLLRRPGFDLFRTRARTDLEASHLFVSKRDRLARPDNPVDAMMIEYELRSAGLTLVLMGGKILPPIPRGQRISLEDLLTCLIDYDNSGRFRRDLAEKLIHAKIKLAKSGFSIGGEPVYGFRRWLCGEDGKRKRELEEYEIVKMPGCHVVWLPTATGELRVVERILDLIETTPATQIARMLNAEGVPSPKAGRTRKIGGISVETSGQWTQNTIKNIVTHPLLVAVWVYGKRSEGDQLRFTESGPRPLSATDYHPDGKLRTVVNPAEQRIRTPAKSGPVTTPEKFERVREVLEHRGRHLKGKARTRGESPNPLGGRIYDLNCGWLLYRNAKRGGWSYSCGLYQNSEAKCCRHNMVRGETATRLVLATLRQRLMSPASLSKLEARLRELANAESTDDPGRAQFEADKAELATVRRKLPKVEQNLAFAETREAHAVVASIHQELKAQEARLAQRIADYRSATPQADPQREVEAALATLGRLAESVSSGTADLGVVGEVFRLADAKLYLRFSPVESGRRKLNVPAGGFVTFGSTPPPGLLYTGPTERVIIRKMLESGESVTATPGHGVPGGG